MTIDKLDVDAVINNAKQLLADGIDLSPRFPKGSQKLCNAANKLKHMPFIFLNTSSCLTIEYRNILRHFKGTLCHDHWKPYYRYNMTQWLTDLNGMVNEAEDVLNPD